MMASEHPAGRIGPNAIIQVAAALERTLGEAPGRALVRSVGLGGYLDAPPQELVDEYEVITLHAAVRERLPPEAARAIALAAGARTADYLLANRIPRAAQLLLRALPAPLASRVLLAAIGRNAWTFAGSGRYRAVAGRPVVIEFGDCPICRGARSGTPLCDYYGATFERLFQVLVHAHARCTETACIAAGAHACRFELDWH